VKKLIRSISVLLMSACVMQGAGAQFFFTGPGFVPDANGINLDDPRANKIALSAAREFRFIYFDFDSYVITLNGQRAIEAHAQALLADSSLRVVLEGHMDDRGGREYNLGNGQKRADAVRRALSAMGVPERQMEAVSFGKEKPAVPGNTEAAMTENRRVEIFYR
jgi:peptidoglycan-associated lipoprotein